MSGFWSGYIIVLTLGSIIATGWLLFANRTRSAQPENQATTGHSVDGIEEYDNPLPFWWLLMFAIALAFAIGYLVFYPGLGNMKGLLGWTQIEQWEREVAAAETKYGALFAKYRKTPIKALAGTPAAVKMGQRLFANDCAQCHGLDARGAPGFPNLTDNEWQWGGTPDAIRQTIIGGRNAVMPPWGQILGDEGVHNVALYVQSLSGIVTEKQGAAGKTQFTQFCTACHGPDGTGNVMFGAPNLTNDTWLYSADLEQIEKAIRNGITNRMPAHGDLLTEDKIHVLTAFVYSLRKP